MGEYILAFLASPVPTTIMGVSIAFLYALNKRLLNENRTMGEEVSELREEVSELRNALVAERDYVRALKKDLTECRRRKAKKVGDATLDFIDALKVGEPWAVDALKDVLKQ
jgi:hypothetical protein